MAVELARVQLNASPQGVTARQDGINPDANSQSTHGAQFQSSRRPRVDRLCEYYLSVKSETSHVERVYSAVEHLNEVVPHRNEAPANGEGPPPVRAIADPDLTGRQACEQRKTTGQDSKAARNPGN